MRMALGTTDGEPVDVEKRMRAAKHKARRLTDPEVLRVRRAFMARMRATGSPLREIAAFFRCSIQNVHQQLMAMEGDDGGVRRSA